MTPVLIKKLKQMGEKNSDATEQLLIPILRVIELMDEQMNLLDFWFLATNKAKMSDLNLPVNTLYSVRFYFDIVGKSVKL